MSGKKLRIFTIVALSSVLLAAKESLFTGKKTKTETHLLAFLVSGGNMKKQRVWVFLSSAH